MLAEEAAVLAFTGDPSSPQWLGPDQPIEELVDAVVTGNVDAETARDFLGESLAAMRSWHDELEQRARTGAERLATSHARVREDARMSGTVEVTPTLPVDVLGLYLLLPGPAAGGVA